MPEAATNDLQHIPRLEDPVLLLLDVLCQLETKESRQEALQVVRRLLALCSEHIYAFEESCEDATKSPKISSRNIIVLKTLIDTIKTLSSRDNGDDESVQTLIDITQEMCAQSMNAVYMATLFNFMRLSQSPARRLVLQMQKRLVEMDPLPRAVFSTKGSTAGLLVPSDEQLFTKKGYSCSFGIRLDANAIDAALYSFCGQNGQGVSASLRNNILILKMVARQGCVQQVEVPFSNYVTTMKKEWVHLCIVHAKKMVFKDKVTVYVNGINVFDGNLGYPDPLTMLGGKFSIGLERLVDGLNGKLWRPTLFGVALSAAEVQTLHWRTHWKNDLYAVAAGQPDESKMCFCYDARSCDLKKRICYDVSGKDNHGSLEPGTSVSVTQSFAHALESFGGCACFLLPLLDRIPEAADFHPVHEFETMEIADLFAFVGAGLSSSSACCSHFVRLEGVNIVGYILQSISPSDLSLSVLKGLVSIVEAVINFLESDDRIIEYINCLLFLNTNWFYSPFETQVKLLGEVLPTFLQILQAATLRERNCLVGTRPSSSSRGKLVFSRAPSLSESWSINNQVDVSFFCWLLSHVYVVQASSEKDKFATVQMSSQQFAQLHELLLQKLIDPLLFPSVQDAATDQWRQLMGFLFQQCEIRSTKGSCDRDSRSIEKLIQYVTKNIALAEPCKATADLLARQLQVTTNIQNLSKGSVRLFWTLMSSANYNVRLAALQLFEMYTTTENVVLNKSDMLMLYWSFQGHPLTDDLADLLLDIVIGRKPLSQGNEKESADVRMGNFARMSFIPIVLLGLIHNANLKVQASILAEIRVQMASPTMGENVKEVVRSWPSLLSRLRSLALEAVAVSSSIEKQREASFVNSETLNKASSILSDNLVSSSEKVEVLQAIADYREVCGCDFALSLLQGRNQSEAVTRAITTMVIEHFPHRSPELICILVNHMIIDTIVYCILHVRNGWMHFLEFYFYHCQFPRDLVSLTAVICEQVIEQTSPTSSKVQIGIVWENVCQVAAVISQSSLVATKMVEDLKLNDVILSPSQQTILTRSACKLWQFVLPHWDRMNWDAMAATLLETSDYGSDVTSEETYIFTHLVANCTRAVFLALQTTIQDVKESQSSSKNDDKLAQKFHDILKLSALIDTLQFGLENSEKATVHMYTLDSCLTFLEASLETNDIECVELLVKVIVALANTAESFYDFSSRPALLKTLQIMSSTDLSFFKELSQFRELVMLWIYCRQNHHACCDSELFNTVSHQLHAEFIANWIYVMKHNTLDFNPYLVQQDASSQAELLGAEIQQCEDLWNDIVDVSEAPDVGRVREQEILDESRIVEVKRSAAKLATSVRKLLARSSHDEPDSSPVFREDGTAENQVKSRKPTDGRVWKIDTRENNLRMRLRMKRVSQDARARNLSYEYRTSSLSDTESKSGNQLCRQFRVPTENNLVDLEHSWRSDGGSDYSDFLADTQMRSVIIQSLSNPEAHETADGKGSDDDEFEEIDDPFQRKRRWEQNSTEHDGDAHSHLKNSSSGHVQAISSAQDCADRTEIAVRKEGAMVTSESSFVRSPMASPPRSGFSLGASVLTVVGGMADFFQKSVQDAKDALESNIDSLYTTKDAISEDSQALMQGMSFYTPRNYVLPVESVRSDNCTEEPTCNLMKERKHGTEKSESVSESSLPSPTTRLSREGEDAPTKFDLQLDAQLMRHMHVVQGKLIVTRSSVHFVAERVVDESEAALVEKKSGIPVDQAWPFLLKRRRWKIDDIASLYRRRYFLKPTALELFIFSTRKNYFFNLTSGNVVLFYKTLMARKPLLLKRDPNVRRLRHPSTLFCNSQCTIRWIQHEISTFEYLMWLNTIAGRTYNDLTQYPVFPWILADYESTTLDLGRRAAYRDLTKPMGALEPTRLKFYVDRYNTFEDTDIPKFM
ncbi:hypothetical protein PsorP6_002106 [Peronosclerospora sorghi]|uniref:Uncharacterized protein n=1 Tax=Peronosclerospora sorghi TaxID=230839 RepID=A0ACC0WSY9_9STRA|nr:hypothetical protein PsorP6_002106 [Peronosclerospora sorghi]